MQHSLVRPTINHTKDVDETLTAKLNLTLKKAQKRDGKCCLSKLLDLGGHNAMCDNLKN